MFPVWSSWQTNYQPRSRNLRGGRNTTLYRQCCATASSTRAWKRTHKQKAASSPVCNSRLGNLAEETALLNYAVHMLHARPLRLNVAVLLAKWYTGTLKVRSIEMMEADRGGGWFKRNTTTTGHQQLDYCSDSMLPFNTTKKQTKHGCGWMDLCLPCSMYVNWYCSWWFNSNLHIQYRVI